MARLGSVSGSRISLIAPQPRQPDLFGGLQGALGRRRDALLQNEDSAYQLEQVEAERNLKLERSRALVGWSDTQARIELEQAELAKQYDPTGKDFRQAADAIAQKYTDQFRSSLPGDLQVEFDPNIAEYRNNRSAVAYDTQYSMEGANYKKGLADIQKRALDSIFLGDSTIEDWVPQLQAYYDNSPLPEAETELLIEETNRNLQSMEFAKQAEDEVTNWIQYPDTDEETGMPAGMPGYAVGLMGAISATESGGAYNVINGGETFTDMSDHPRRRGAGGTSTAAGKYQFVEATWDRAAAALNLPDFSPASQEKAAWWLAGEDYRARTGRNLEADLASGDPVLVENVRKVLGGQGDENVTWKGLQDLSPQDFYAYVTGGKTVPPSIMKDPTYSSLTEVEKANTLAIAQKQSNEHLANMLKSQNQQRDMLVSQMKDAIAGGAITQQQLSTFINTQAVDQATSAELTKLYNEHNADEINLQKFGVALQTPGAAFGPDERKGFDVLYNRESSKAVGDQDQEYMNSTVLPFVGRSGYFPAQLITDLTNMARGTDPQRAAFAWQNLAMMQQQNPSGFAKAFDEGMTGEVEFFRQRSNYYPPAEVIQQMMDAKDPTKRAPREVVQKEAETYIKDNSKYFSATGIAGELDIDISATSSDMAQMSALEAEFMSVFSAEMGRYRNGDEAYEAAKNRIAAKWGSVSYGTGEPYLLRNPPAKSGLPQVAGSFDWVETYAREQLGGDKPFRFSSDHVTEAEINSGQPPSYLVLEDYGDGIFLPRVNPETGLPVRLALDPPDLKEQSLDSELWFKDVHKLDSFMFVDTAPQQQAAVQAAGPLFLAARQALLAAKPKYTPLDGTSFADPEVNDNFRLPTEPVSPESVDAALSAFGFDSLEQFLTFTRVGDMNALMQRYKPQ